MKLQQTTGNRLLSLLIALAFALTMYPTKAKAQITGDLEVDVPFPFHAGNSKLPPGKYFIHVLDNSDLNIMEITSGDGATSALFEVHAAEANSAPAKTPCPARPRKMKSGKRCGKNVQGFPSGSKSG